MKKAAIFLAIWALTACLAFKAMGGSFARFPLEGPVLLVFLILLPAMILFPELRRLFAIWKSGILGDKFWDPAPPATPAERAERKVFRYVALAVAVPIALLLLMFIMIYVQDKVSPVYSLHREPAVVRTETIEGFQVKIVRWSSWNPLLRALDYMFLQSPERAYADSGGGEVNFIQIDLSVLEENGREIEKNWKEYEANSRLDPAAPGWDFEKQVLYNYLKDFKDKARAYADCRYRETLEHELQHARDIRAGIARYDPARMKEFIEKTKGTMQWVMEMDTPAKQHDETRAYLASLKLASSGVTLIVLKRQADKSPGLSALMGYTGASKYILKGFRERKKFHSDSQLAFLPAAEINRLAAEMLEELSRPGAGAR